MSSHPVGQDTLGVPEWSQNIIFASLLGEKQLPVLLAPQNLTHEVLPKILIDAGLLAVVSSQEKQLLPGSGEEQRQILWRGAGLIKLPARRPNRRAENSVCKSATKNGHGQMYLAILLADFQGKPTAISLSKN